MASNEKIVRKEKSKALEHWVESDEEVGGKIVAHKPHGHHLFQVRDSAVRFLEKLRDAQTSDGGRVIKYRLCTRRYTVSRGGWE
ncbi:hypothetical protein MCERE19_02268 [Spirosomataceae bacterium]